MRSFISLAALLVKVNAMIRMAQTIVEQIHYLVCEDAGFPEPAPAMTSDGPSYIHGGGTLLRIKRSR